MAMTSKEVVKDLLKDIFEGITDDGAYPFFRFLYKNVGYVGCIHGAGETEYAYAAMLPSYIESFVEKEAELSKTEYLKRILRGECSSLGVYKYAAKFSVRDGITMLMSAITFK